MNRSYDNGGFSFILALLILTLSFIYGSRKIIMSSATGSILYDTVIGLPTVLSCMSCIFKYRLYSINFFYWLCDQYLPNPRSNYR